MVIGEALNRRADLRARISGLQERIRECVVEEEGVDPPEDATVLLAEVGVMCDELEGLIAQINQSNAVSRLSTGETVTEALARRDVIAVRRKALTEAVAAAAGRGLYSLRRGDARMVRQVSVAELQAEIDSHARERRELENMLQQHNWTAPLVG